MSFMVIHRKTRKLENNIINLYHCNNKCKSIIYGGSEWLVANYG